MCSEDSVQFLWPQVAIISFHVEMNVHRFLLSVCYAENVDARRPDGQGFGQEVPERLQPALPLDVSVDKIPHCNAFGRQRERGFMQWELPTRQWQLQSWSKSTEFPIPLAQEVA